MGIRPECSPEFLRIKQPHRDEVERLIVDHAPEVTWEWAENYWEKMNRTMEMEGVDRKNCQVVVLSNRDDVTVPLYHSLVEQQIGRYSVANTIEEEYADGELEIRVQDEAVNADSVYIVASLLTERDFARARAVADHYKHVLNAKCVTLVCSFLGRGRQDKNVDKDNNYVPWTINIRSEIGGLSPFVDRMIVLEPHSSATQAYAAEFSIALAPLSPWQFMLENLRKHEDITPENAVVARPDLGRNLAATRAQEYLHLQSVSFSKERKSGTDVEIYELSREEQELVKGKKVIVYDDEASTMTTLEEIANALLRYKAKELIACLIHCKFTPGWRDKVKHELFSLILGTDSRTPIGNIQMVEEIERISLVPLLRNIIEADIKGLNFWEDEQFRGMILHEFPTRT